MSETLAKLINFRGVKQGLSLIGLALAVLTPFKSVSAFIPHQILAQSQSVTGCWAKTYYDSNGATRAITLKLRNNNTFVWETNAILPSRNGGTPFKSSASGSWHMEGSQLIIQEKNGGPIMVFNPISPSELQLVADNEIYTRC